MHLTLYQRDDCHLCDQALALLARSQVPEFTSVFIDDDRELEQRFGARIPVLRDEDSGSEIDWPFDTAAIAALLAR